ncbi:hypothetical protein BRAS3843_2220026 [Bradyrhizobium sp. STM 3843]|uniref:hypothetical protein n=1 Tax=Bradyrhizobium sp. STM 3843 TaxID=551947 RepID=UPI000240B0EF|nr:hypothetical protein [Bradyrhizobium sp. STM 3843]CCE07565.1 hypothetical protein BRAS3843_2220026 [Bradyrhizobium sp. STM 3843]
MKTTRLTEVLKRIEAWPADAQDDLAEFVLVLDAGVRIADEGRQRSNWPAPVTTCAPPSQSSAR